MTGSVTVNGSVLSTELQDLLQSNDSIQPGSAPSYQLCKTLYEYHPLGARIVEAPVLMAQSQKREIAIPDSPEEVVRDKFSETWEAMRIDETILNGMASARTYGISTCALVTDDDRDDREKPVDFAKLSDPGREVAFSTFDPLNTAGSLVLNQNANAFDFQKIKSVAVQGQRYHPSRTCVMMNERPIFIGYTTSAFGYVGRSVYQRALFPLKSFLNTMVTDDMVSLKAGLLIAKVKQPGSIVDNLMQMMSSFKLAMLKAAVVGNVLQVGHEDGVESLNLQNLDGAFGNSRTNILTNIATAVPMPARWLKQDTLTVGFGEGSEDAKSEAKYVDNFRETMQPLYGFMDRVVQRRAWTPDFYKVVQDKYPDRYGDVSYNAAFQQWANSFTALWPSLLTEPDSEKIKVDDLKLKAVIALMEVLLPLMDPENKIAVVRFACDTFNELKLLFPNPILLDFDALESYEPPEQQAEPSAPKPFRVDSEMTRRALGSSRWQQYDKAIAAITEIKNQARTVQ